MAHSISRRQFLQGSGAAALSVAAAGLLSSCGGSSASNGGSTGAAGSSSTYTVLYSRQPATLNYLVCSADPDLYHGTQCIDTLVEYDNRGKIREGLATAWEWDADSLTWTFHLRDARLRVVGKWRAEFRGGKTVVSAADVAALAARWASPADA